ncbi:MAG: ABC transporter permease subunit [Lachnospiraceae bacterium]|nr:ABC transporter permease subunit [Lachnospiraceae bacterium]
MLTIYKNELKTNLKSLLIWVLCVGGMGFACILLFADLADSMKGMAESFASMGAFSDAFGMNQLSIATLSGFYATEIGTIHTLGGAMFAAICSICMLSKEEDGHTSEFLFSLPVSRVQVVTAKWLTITTLILLFNLLCVLFYLTGISMLGEEIALKEFCLYHTLQFVMHLELAAICFTMSACMKKNRFGMGLGVVLFLYAYDLISKITPNLSDYKLLSPFSFANASDIFSTGKSDIAALILGGSILLGCICITLLLYKKRDLAA